MKVLEKAAKRELWWSIVLVLLSIPTIALAIYLLKTEPSNLFGAIFLIVFGVLFLSTPIWAIRHKKRVNSALKNGTTLNAIIDRTEEKAKYGTIICYADINGERHKFVSEPVEFDIDYACRELNITEIPVLVNMQKPTEYVVDTRKVLDRVVDLRKVGHSILYRY